MSSGAARKENREELSSGEDVSSPSPPQPRTDDGDNRTGTTPDSPPSSVERRKRESNNSNEPISFEERQRQKRMAANRRSAAVSRQRRLDLIDSLKKNVSELSSTVKALSGENEELRRQLQFRTAGSAMSTSAMGVGGGGNIGSLAAAAAGAVPPHQQQQHTAQVLATTAFTPGMVGGHHAHPAYLAAAAAYAGANASGAAGGESNLQASSHPYQVANQALSGQTLQQLETFAPGTLAGQAHHQQQLSQMPVPPQTPSTSAHLSIEDMQRQIKVQQQQIAALTHVASSSATGSRAPSTPQQSSPFSPGQ